MVEEWGQQSMASINWGSGVIYVPKTDLDLVQSVPTEIYNLNLNAFRLNLNDLADDIEGISFIDTHVHNTEVTLAGLTYARVIEILDPYTVTFEDGQYAVNLIGANSNVADRVNVNQVSVRAQNSAGLITTQAIEFGEYGESVCIDIDNGSSGQVYPVGTRRKPSNNTTDAVGIANFYGFSKINALKDMDFGLTNLVPDDIRGFTIYGETHLNTTIVINTEALCLKTGFIDCDISGVLDGDSEIRNCIVRNLTFFNGHIHDSALVGTITLSGNLNAVIENCRILDFNNPPIIDAGGSGQDLMMSNFSGIVIVRNLTGNSKMGIGLDAGQVIIEDTCTAGLIQVSGTGSIVDNSGPNCYVIDSVINGTDVQNLSRLIELQRPHHTGTGNIWFWDPENGNDGWDGKHVDRATKTFAQAHTLAVDNNHDIIICVAGSTTGSTLTTENITITKNYLFVRGPGRDFIMHGNNDAIPTIDIQSNGIEISSLVATNNVTNTTSVIKASGSFPLIKDLYIEESGNGIHITDGSFGILQNVRVSHGTGYGVLIDGNSEHFVIDNSHIGSNTLDGVDIDLSTGHEVTIQNGSIIHGNGGFGVNISANTSGVQIGASNSIFGNTLGQVNDLSTNTHFEQLEIAAVNANTLLSTDLTPYDDVNTVGGSSAHAKHLEYKLYIDTELVAPPVEDGSQHNPFSTENTAIDFAELHNILNLRIMSDITFTRQIRNFYVDSINIAKVDANGQDLDGSRFSHINLTGTYTGSITVQDSKLTGNNTSLNGNFENCGLGSTFEVPDGGFALIKNCTAISTDFTKPIISVGGVAGTAQLALMWYIGGITITNCNQPTDIVKIIAIGIVEIDSTCTNGSIIVLGNVAPIDNSGPGCTVQWMNLDPSKLSDIPSDVWNHTQ